MTLTSEPTYSFRPSTTVLHSSGSRPFPHLATHALLNLHPPASSVYILISSTLSGQHPDLIAVLRVALLDADIKIVGEKVGLAPHSNWTDLLPLAKDVAQKNPSAILTVGGGSYTDAAKVLALTLANPPANHEFSYEYLESLTGGSESSPPTVPVVCVPTTLSAAEYSAFAGAVDPRSNTKRMFNHPDMAPKWVCLDPKLGVLTPQWVWVSTGVRAIDHCVEVMCSLQPNVNKEAVEAAKKGLRGLVAGLLKTVGQSGKENEPARLEALLGARWSMDGPCRGYDLGGSHGIGHQLGTYGVAHGHTSCVLLPAVCRYNKSVNGDKQERVLEVLKESAPELLGDGWEGDVCDALDTVFRKLQMPRTLKEVGVGPEKLMELAEKSLEDRWCKTNPRPLTEKGQVLEVLNMVVE